MRKKRFEPGRIVWRRALREPEYFARAVLNVRPHPGQTNWLRNSTGNENLLVTGNRWGKSFVQAIKILHRAFFRIRLLECDEIDRYTVVSASITQDQANIIFNTVCRIVRGNEMLAALVKSIKKTPYPEMIFGNGSIITARSTQNRGHYLLGHDYDFFSFDEAAFESDPEYLINDVIMMRLADRNGVLDLISTPNGKNWFYRRMLRLQKQTDGYVQFGDSRENPYLSERALKARVASLPPDRVAQNIEGRFVDNDKTIFSGGDIDRALTGESFSRSYYQNPCRDRSYISGWDLARKRTHTVGMIFDVSEKPFRLVALDRFNNRNWSDVISLIRRRQAEFGSRLVVDATGLGDVVVSELADLNPTGVIFTPRQKGELLANLVLLHNRGDIKYPDVIQREPGRPVWSLEGEMREICWENNNQFDAVMAMALAIWPKRNHLLFPGSGPLPARIARL